MNASVITTYRCNAKCHMCNIWKFPTEIEEELTPDIIAKLPDGLGRINLTGGEPTLRDDIEELVGILYKKCQKVEISTNGFYTERLVRIAERYPGIMIRVSLEGLPALNDRLRGTKDGFDHALRTMLELKKTKLKDIGFSVVICDKNISDLVALYELSVWLGVEFAQSTMHNSWYFHKTDNEIADRNSVATELERFIAALLTSKRKGLKMRIKDWLRAYFNQRIYQHATTGYSCQGVCTAGSDIFFVDPYANILPCNGSDSKWIMGNLKSQSFDEIWNSAESERIRKMVSSCSKDCAFIGTARFDMLRNPFSTARWVLKNKLKAMRGQPLCIGDAGSEPTGVNIDDLPVVKRQSQKKLVIR